MSHRDPSPVAKVRSHARWGIDRSVHHLARPASRFNWLLGLRLVVVFGGPTLVWHLTGAGAEDAAAFALAGLVISLFVLTLPTLRARLTHGLGFALMPPLTELLIHLSRPFGPGWMVLVTMTAAVVGLSLGLSGWLPRYVAPVGLSVMLLGTLPDQLKIVPWLFLGGLAAMALAILTQPLTHPRVGLPRLSPPVAPPPPPPWELVVHNAVRRVVGTVIAAITIYSFRNSTGDFERHSYWILYSLWLVLQQPRGATLGKGYQRMVGTVVGAGLTFLIVQLWPVAWWTGWLTMALTFLAWGLWRVNYSWFVALFAPVVLLQLAGPAYDPDAVRARIVWTLIGAALAIVLQLVMWPGRENQLLEAIEAAETSTI